MKPDSFLLILLAGSLGLNVYLGVSARRHQHEPGPSPDTTLPIGTSLPPPEGKALDGRPIRVVGGEAGDKRDIAVYVFSTTCSWCEKNLNSIRTLAHRMGMKYRFIGVATSSPEGLRAYAEQKALNFEVIGSISEAQKVTYDLGGTPQLLILSADGHLKVAFKGAFSGQSKKEAEAFFGTVLPGLEARPEVPANPRVDRGLCVDPWGLTFDRGFRWPVNGLLQTCGEGGWVPVGA